MDDQGKPTTTVELDDPSGDKALLRVCLTGTKTQAGEVEDAGSRSDTSNGNIADGSSGQTEASPVLSTSEMAAVVQARSQML